MGALLMRDGCEFDVDFESVVCFNLDLNSKKHTYDYIRRGILVAGIITKGYSGTTHI